MWTKYESSIAFDTDYLFHTKYGYSAMDVSTTDTSILVRLDVPGITLDDISLTLEDDYLIIKGERKKVLSHKNEKFTVVDRYMGKFSRTLKLNTQVDVNSIKAILTNGVLVVEIPKSENAKSKTIPILEG